MPKRSAWVTDTGKPIPREVAQIVLDIARDHGAAILASKMSHRQVRELGVSQRLAEAIAHMVRQGDPRLGRPVPEDATVAAEPDSDLYEVRPDHNAPVRTLPELLDHLDLDLDRYRVESWTPKTWAQGQKLRKTDEDGNAYDELQTVRLWGHTLKVAERPVPLSVVDQWTPMDLAPVEPRPNTDVETMLVVPDTQVGYRWSWDYKTLTPIHDRRAMDLALQMAARLKRAGTLVRVLLLGDMLDLAPWSLKFPRPAELRQTTTPSIRAYGMWQRQLRTEVGPSVVIDLDEGNHEHRITKALVEQMPELATLRGLDSDEPIVSLPRLLGCPEAGVNYIGPYGKGHWVPGLEDALFVQHGVKVRTGPGATSAAVLRAQRYSSIFGHVHRVEQVHDTIQTPAGPVMIAAGTPGCMCRTDGAVPGHPGTPNWQQGIGIVHIDRRAGHTTMQMLPIRDGRLCYEGVVLVGEDYAEREAEWTGFEQVAVGRSVAA